MKFYAIEGTLEERLKDRRIRLRVQVAFDFTGTGVPVTVPEFDVISVSVTSLKEKTGGTVTRATIELDNTLGTYCPRYFETYRPDYNKYNGEKQSDGLGNLRPGIQVYISYSSGQSIPFVWKWQVVFPIRRKDVFPFTIKLLFKSESNTYITERVWHESQIMTENEDGSVLLEYQTTQIQEALRWVLSQGSRVQVLSPPELIQMVKLEADAVAAQYK